MDDQPTCGRGRAGSSALPDALGQLADAMAGLLDARTRALDPADSTAKTELDS